MKIQNSIILKQTIILLIVCFNSSVLFAQDNSGDSLWLSCNSFYKFNAYYSPCIIQKKDGIVMKCFSIDNKKYSPKGTLMYLESLDDKRKGIKVKELQSIQFVKNKHEMIIPVQGKREYMALKAVEGKVSLYVFKELKHIYLPIMVPYGGILKITYDKYYRFLKSGSECVSVRKGKFKESMTVYFKDQAPVVEEINNEIYNFLNMEIMVSEYNSLNLGNHNWNEKAMPFEQIRPKENSLFFVPSAKGSATSGPKLATVYIYNEQGKKNTSIFFQVYQGDSLIGNLKNGSIYKYQYEADAIKEFTLKANGQKASCKFLINPGRLYYLVCKWDEKNQKLVLKVENPVSGQYYADQNNRSNK